MEQSGTPKVSRKAPSLTRRHSRKKGASRMLRSAITTLTEMHKGQSRLPMLIKTSLSYALLIVITVEYQCRCTMSNVFSLPFVRLAASLHMTQSLTPVLSLPA